MSLSSSYGANLQSFNPAFRMPQTMGISYQPAATGFPASPMPAASSTSVGDSFTLNNSLTTDASSTNSSKPDLTMTSFSQLTPENVNSKGQVKGMLFDVDDTLSKYTLGKRTIPPQVLKQLKQLQDSGIKLGIVTNNPSKKTAENFQNQLKAAGINMPMIIHADKPSPKGLEMMEQQMGLPASQMMMVGDQSTDVESGKKAGFKTLQVDWFGNSSFHKDMMHQADEALLSLDKFKAKFDSDPDQPEFIPAPKDTATQTASQAASA